LPAIPTTAIQIEARTEFESFDPMELAANASEVELLLQGWVASHATDRIETSVGVGTGGRVPRSVVLALIMHNGGLACEVLVFSRPIMRHDPPH
jgi:hypothetical protein